MFKKLERILGVVGAVVGILGLALAYQQLRHDQGGDLEVLFNSTPVSGNTGSRSIVVCLDNVGTSVSDLQFAPAFNNISKYPVRDFSLQHSVNVNGVDINANGFYNKIHYNGNTDVYSYVQDKLPSFSMTPYPFENVSILNNDAACSITTRASFDGADAPYEYETKLYFMVIPRNGGNFEMWKRKCNERLSHSQLPPETDVYYRASDGFAYSKLVNIDKTPEPIAAVPTGSGTKNAEKPHKSCSAAPFAIPSKPKSNPVADDKPKTIVAAAPAPVARAMATQGPVMIESYTYNRNDSMFSITIKPLKENVNAVVRIVSADGKRQYADLVRFTEYAKNYSFKVYWNWFAKNKDNSVQTEVSRADIIYQDSVPEKINMTIEKGDEGKVYTKVSSDKNLIALFGNNRTMGIPQKPSSIRAYEDLSKYNNDFVTFTIPDLDNANGGKESIVERIGSAFTYAIMLLNLIMFPAFFIVSVYIFISEYKNKEDFWERFGLMAIQLVISILCIWLFWPKVFG